MNGILQRLSPRDRKVLLWTLPVIGILIVLVAARFLLAERQQVTGDLERVLEDLAWLQAQRDSMAVLEPGCDPAPWREDSLDRLAAKYDVAYSRLAATGGVALTLEASHGNQVIAFLRDLECRGAAVRELELETLDDGGTVTGRAVVRLPVT